MATPEVVVLDSDSDSEVIDARRATGARASTASQGARRRDAAGSGAEGRRKRGAGRRVSAGVVDLTAESQSQEDEDDIVLVSSSKKRKANGAGVEIIAPPGAKQTLQKAKGLVPGVAYELKCAVCLEKMKEMSSTICGHVFCAKCIRESIMANGKCPTCRKGLSSKNIHRIYI